MKGESESAYGLNPRSKDAAFPLLFLLKACWSLCPEDAYLAAASYPMLWHPPPDTRRAIVYSLLGSDSLGLSIFQRCWGKAYNLQGFAGNYDASLVALDGSRLYFRAVTVWDYLAAPRLSEFALAFDRNSPEGGPAGDFWWKTTDNPDEWQNSALVDLTWGATLPIFVPGPWGSNPSETLPQTTGRGVRYNAPEITCGNSAGELPDPAGWPPRL